MQERTRCLVPFIGTSSDRKRISGRLGVEMSETDWQMGSDFWDDTNVQCLGVRIL